MMLLLRQYIGLSTLCLLMFSSACSPEIKEGEIESKEFHPASTVMAMMPVTTSNGRSSTTDLVPMFFYYPDSYSIRIKKFTGKQWEHTTYWVDSYTYSNATIGGYYKASSQDMDERPRTVSEGVTR